ncbi:MAG: alanine racemase [Oscillospiraceae bacterium]|nr:alanine racemase [Oscillospiraceae bacterium]
MNTPKRAFAEINLKNIEHNFREIARHVDGADIITVIKADAYGHGAVELARLYTELGAKMLAVACLDEALELRAGGITLPILIFGATPPEYADLLAKNSLTQAVGSYSYAKALSDALQKTSSEIKIHIKLDTGMTRMGIYAHTAFSLPAADEAEKITKLPSLCAEGIFTHFAESDGESESFTDEQFAAFEAVLDELSRRGTTFKFCHCANSAAVINYKKTHLNCVRPGLILYGISPMGKNESPLDLRPAMTLYTTVADVREIKQGDYISYNRTERATRDMKIAILSCGYADGFFRLLSRCGEVKLFGKRAKVLGNVCMDLIAVDATDIPEVKQFDVATVFDGELIYEHASLAKTITYEILTSVSKRVERTYTNSPA